MTVQAAVEAILREWLWAKKRVTGEGRDSAEHFDVMGISEAAQRIAALPLMGVMRRDRDAIALKVQNILAETLEAADDANIIGTGKASYQIADAVLSLPAQSGSVQCREDVARIIDEWAWRVCTSTDQDPPGMEMVERWEAALAKADAVLSLPKPAGQPVEGWRTILKALAQKIERATPTNSEYALAGRDGYIRALADVEAALSPAPASPQPREGRSR